MVFARSLPSWPPSPPLPPRPAVLRTGRRLLAALLLLSRFFVENLSRTGLPDISYIALIVVAIGARGRTPEARTAVFVALAAAGLLRPDAWVLQRRLTALVYPRIDNRRACNTCR